MAINDPSKFYRERTPRPLSARLTMDRDLDGGLQVSEKVVTSTVDPFKSNLGFYDPAFALPPSISNPLGAQAHALDEQTHFWGQNLMLGNGHPSGMPNIPVSSASASDSNRSPGPPRRSNQQRQQRFPSRRSTVNQTSLHVPHVFYPPPSPHIQDNAQQSATRGLAPSPLYLGGPLQPYHTMNSPYNQPTNYGQYTMSPQPPVNLGLNTPSYPYTHGFHHGVHNAMDSNMLSQSPHVGFRPVISHSPVYQFPSHSSDGGSSSQSPFSTGSSPYSLPLVNLSSPPQSPLTSQQTSGTPVGPQHPSSYGSQANQYQAIRYNNPSTPYSYTPQTILPSSFQGQFAPSPYSQHYPQPSEDGMAAWWYMPHSGPIPTYNENMQMQYQHHYPISYPHMGRPDIDPHYHRPPPAATTMASNQDVSRQHTRRLSQNFTPSLSNIHQRASSSASQGSGSPAPSSKTDHSIASLPAKLQSDRETPLLRRSYHPNPPAHRSAWVMWVGNVPADTSHDEFWRFLHQPLPLSSFTSVTGKSSSSLEDDAGVTSIFLIARSNCAFVNCDSEEHLHAAISRFNGVPLRAHDSRCPRLVCRVRRPDDDLRAGVGGQRGIGMHMRWVREQVRHAKETEDPPQSSASEDPTSSASCSPTDAVGQFLRPTTSLPVSSEEDLGHSQVRSKSYGMKTRSSTGSYASTNSSILSRYFPKRFFILKSLTQSDLDTSVEEGLWATQKHNEGILDQAYRTSQEVYLIFGVNKSGEFYGYARMASRILRGEHRVSWAGQTDSSSSPPVSSIQGHRQSLIGPEEYPLTGQKTSGKGKEISTYFSPAENRMVEGSPLPLLSSQNAPSLGISKGGVSLAPAVRPPIITASGRTPRSAPAELGAPHREVTSKESITKFSLSEKARSPAEEFALDRSAPIRALRDKKGTDDSKTGTASSLQPVKEENNDGDAEGEHEVEEKTTGKSGPDQGIVPPKDRETHEATWGEPFKVEWLCTERLPFYQTRHVRNPWNHDREVKVSRDGTELEPGVGQQLLDEWLVLAHTTSQAEGSRNAGGPGRRATKSTPTIQPAESSGGRRGLP